MIIKRLVAAGVWLCFAAMLGACSPFAGYVADHVPHWAGGLPPDAPPRPGAPGYEDFIAHGEPAQAPATPPSSTDASPAAASTGAIPSTAAAMSEPHFQARNAKPTTNSPPRNAKAQRGPARPAPVQASAQQARQAAAPEESAEAPAAEDQSVVKGGLY